MRINLANMTKAIPSEKKIFVNKKKNGKRPMIVCRFEKKVADKIKMIADSRGVPIALVVRELVNKGLRK